MPLTSPAVISTRPRAEFIRAQCAGAHTEALELFTAYAWQWTGLSAAPDKWTLGAATAIPSFERGFVTQLRLHSQSLAGVIPLRQLFVCEPITEVLFEVGVARPERATAARTLLPFPRPVAVKVTRLWSPNRASQDAFFAALLSAPVMASASEVTLAGLSPGRTGTPLVPWLSQSPFLSGIRVLNLSHNGFGDPEVCDLAQNPRLARVERLSLAHNRISNTGAIALARSPHLRNVTRIDLTSNRIGGDGLAALAARFGNGLVA
ncbi:Uncharacterized protein OS=Nitrospina gracilis (strain 3/211) GN=NITGR_780005 PE=4 SV=1: LRR_6: LRR_6: LRR_6 [Gemmata massiliana]|uniref:Repeat-companion domain protein n=1 Tax=Gemmata massiliana TaxID=1210884 RepID=A0A6P2CR37_9BACT|nr:hypothetical protein [Gemmata massiliana]VTR91528.1 Uncharacterized protein OS=Nitrospina gracilis (strain 3/211) GN=NITGR_780005 PE=4 SV=1: LRR_6: LRR_6: LRR_6 [Gemmata massiliana]